MFVEFSRFCTEILEKLIEINLLSPFESINNLVPRAIKDAKSPGDEIEVINPEINNGLDENMTKSSSYNIFFMFYFIRHFPSCHVCTVQIAL